MDKFENQWKSYKLDVRHRNTQGNSITSNLITYQIIANE